MNALIVAKKISNCCYSLDSCKKFSVVSYVTHVVFIVGHSKHDMIVYVVFQGAIVISKKYLKI